MNCAGRAVRPALLLFIAALAAGCTGRDTPPTVLHFWAMGREAEVLTRLLPEFERDHPELRVEVQQLAWTAAHEKLLTAIAGDATGGAAPHSGQRSGVARRSYPQASQRPDARR